MDRRLDVDIPSIGSEFSVRFDGRSTHELDESQKIAADGLDTSHPGKEVTREISDASSPVPLVIETTIDTQLERTSHPATPTRRQLEHTSHPATPTRRRQLERTSHPATPTRREGDHPATPTRRDGDQVALETKSTLQFELDAERNTDGADIFDDFRGFTPDDETTSGNISKKHDGSQNERSAALREVKSGPRGSGVSPTRSISHEKEPSPEALTPQGYAPSLTGNIHQAKTSTKSVSALPPLHSTRPTPVSTIPTTQSESKTAFIVNTSLLRESRTRENKVLPKVTTSNTKQSPTVAASRNTVPSNTGADTVKPNVTQHKPAQDSTKQVIAAQQQNASINSSKGVTEKPPTRNTNKPSVQRKPLLNDIISDKTKPKNSQKSFNKAFFPSPRNQPASKEFDQSIFVPALTLNPVRNHLRLKSSSPKPVARRRHLPPVVDRKLSSQSQPITARSLPPVYRLPDKYKKPPDPIPKWRKPPIIRIRKAHPWLERNARHTPPRDRVIAHRSTGPVFNM